MLAGAIKFVAGLAQLSGELPMRLGYGNELIVQQAHGAYQEAVRQGRVWTLATLPAGVTGAAANVFNAVAAQPLVGIFNPLGSSLNVVIHKGIHQWNSGTPAAGGLVWGTAPAQSVLTGAGGSTEVNALTAVSGGSGVRTFVNTAMTGVAGMVLARYAGGPTVGALAANSNQSYVDWVDGELIVQPGCVCGLFLAAAGTSPIVNASMSFEIVPAG